MSYIIWFNVLKNKKIVASNLKIDWYTMVPIACCEHLAAIEQGLVVKMFTNGIFKELGITESCNVSCIITNFKKMED